jgi:hypothetical protein
MIFSFKENVTYSKYNMGNWISSNEQLTNTIEQQANAIVELKQQVAELQQSNGSHTSPKLSSVSRKNC